MNDQHVDPTGAKLGMWLFLLTEILLFGGMFLLYSVYRAKYSPAFHAAALELNTTLGTVNTVVLLTSSLTMVLSIGAIQRNAVNASLVLQILTVLLGMFFLYNKYLEWGVKIHHGIYPGSPDMLTRPKGELLFFSLYFVMTGLHAVHVVVGLTLLIIMFFFTAGGSIHPGDYIRLENSGLFWHLVDVIWIYLFPLFYLVT